MLSQILRCERQFQMWNYTISHSQLLLRATKSKLFPTRIDVLFKGVIAFHIPTILDGLTITEGKSNQHRSIGNSQRSLLLNKKLRIFGVDGVDFAGYVAALAVSWHEDQGEYNEASGFQRDEA